jgi:hypothetical protein
LTNLLGAGRFTTLETNLFQFAGIEPIAAAAWALVHFDPALGTEKVPVKFYSRAARAIAFARTVYHNVLIALNMKQGFASRLVLFVDALQFERVKPDTATPTLANINFKTTDLNFF